MWWKIYFGLDIILGGVSVASLFDGTKQNIPIHVFLIVTYCFALVGLFTFVFKKQLFPLNFWKYYFWIYLIIDAVYFVYGFIPSPYQKYLSFLSVYSETSVWDSVIDTALDIPLLFALYKLKNGIFYEKMSKKTKKTRFEWGMTQMALWGYSTILTLFLFIISFFPANGGGSTKSAGEPTVNTPIALLFTPLLIFWLWILIQRKQYKWNWWRMTLVANALLYSGSIIFGILVPVSDKATGGGFDIISTVQILILFFSLYFFGREQFNPKKPQENKK
jgi:hypothetical protein